VCGKEPPVGFGLQSWLSDCETGKVRNDWVAAEESQLLVETRLLAAAAVVMGFAGRGNFHSARFPGKSSVAPNYNESEPGAEKADVAGSPEFAAAAAVGFAALVAGCGAAVAEFAAVVVGFAAAVVGFVAAAVEVDVVVALTLNSHSGVGCCRIPLLATAAQPALVEPPHLEVEGRAVAAGCRPSGTDPPLIRHCCLISPVQDCLCVPRGMAELLAGEEIYWARGKSRWMQDYVPGWC